MATVSRPDICDRLARIAHRANPVQGSDVYRINRMVKTAQGLWQAAILKYAASSRPGVPAHRDANGRARSRGGWIRCETKTLVGWSGAAFGDQSAEGKCRLGHVVGPMSSTLSGPCHTPQWTSRITRNLAEGILGGEVYAFSDMIGRMPFLREYYGLAVDLRNPLFPPEERGGRHVGVFGPSLFRYSTFVGNCGIGPRVLAPGPRELGGWLDQGKKRSCPPSTITRNGCFSPGNPLTASRHVPRGGRRVGFVLRVSASSA